MEMRKYWMQLRKTNPSSMIGYRFTPRLSLGVKLTILETRYNQCAAIQRKEVDGDFRDATFMLFASTSGKDFCLGS